MDEMATGQDNHIFVCLLNQLILIINDVLKLKLADTALGVLWLLPLQFEFEDRKVGVRNDAMCLEAALFLLLLKEKEEVINVLVQLMILLDLVILVHFELADSSFETDGVIMRD